MKFPLLINRFGIRIFNELIGLVNKVINSLGITYDIAQLENNYNILNNKVGHNTSQIESINKKIHNVQIPVIYIGTGEDEEDVINDTFKHENFDLGTYVELTPNNENVIICYDSSINVAVELLLSNITIPCETSTVEYGDVIYTTIKTNNKYNDTITIKVK
jgi:hypothetical protein